MNKIVSRKINKMVTVRESNDKDDLVTHETVFVGDTKMCITDYPSLDG